MHTEHVLLPIWHPLQVSATRKGPLPLGRVRLCRALRDRSSLCVAVVSTWKVDEVDETLHVESEPVSECEPGPGPGP